MHSLEMRNLINAVDNGKQLTESQQRDKDLLNEAVMDQIKDQAAKLMSRITSIPGIKPYIQRAQQYRSEVESILKSASSGKEVIDQLRGLAKQEAALAEAGAVERGMAMSLAGQAAGVILVYLQHFFDKIISQPGLEQAWWLGVGLSLAIAILGLFMAAQGDRIPRP